MSSRSIAIAAVLASGLCAGCHSPGGGMMPMTGGSHTFYSRETRPVTVEVVDLRNKEVIFRMDVLHRLVAAGVGVLNPPRALETAVDKYLACCRMEAGGLPVPPTVACENADDALGAMEQLGGDVQTRAYVKGATGPLMLQLKLCGVAAIVVSAPYWLYQIWGFLLPGLLRLLLLLELATFAGGNRLPAELHHEVEPWHDDELLFLGEAPHAPWFGCAGGLGRVGVGVFDLHVGDGLH